MLVSLIALALAAAPTDAERVAIFEAAGFSQRSGEWKSGNCDGFESNAYEPGTIESYRDLDGDGRPEALIIEGGAVCYGNTGVTFWLLSKQAIGSWKVLHSGLGHPEFLDNNGAGGWPDIRVGLPGLCYPILRFNGSTYAIHRREYEGKPCKR